MMIKLIFALACPCTKCVALCLHDQADLHFV